MSRSPFRSSFATLLVVSLAACGSRAPAPFLEARASFQTTLKRHGPTGLPIEDPSGEDVEMIRYRSGDLSLKAFLVRPRSSELARGGRVPLLVYYHGGFAVDSSDVDTVRPFVVAGFAVLIPALRAENGNAGDFEMFYGELDDARAALQHAHTLPRIDSGRIVIFGHSAGGVMSALLSMSPDLHVVEAGSAGGLYDETSFDGNLPLAPPFVDGSEERRLRVPVPNITQLRTHHWACVGRDDGIAAIAQRAAERARAAGAPLELVMTPGDHGGSLPSCIRQYLAHVRPLLDAVPARDLPADPNALPVLAGTRPLATPGAFDLALRPDGALLVWAAPNDPALRVQALGKDGETAAGAATLTITAGQIRELAAGVNGEKLGVVWVLSDGHTTTLRAFAAVGPLGGPLAPPVALGEVDGAALLTTRGNVVIAPRGADFAVAVRARGRCEAPGCATIVVSPSSGGRGRQTILLDHACGSALVGATSNGADALFALCETGALATARVGDGPPVVTRTPATCENVALVGAGGTRPVARCPSPLLLDSPGTDLAPTCATGVLRIGSAITLSAPAAGIAPLLPLSITGPGTRAVWTGNALLVAEREGPELLLHRWSCRDGTLASTDGS